MVVAMLATKLSIMAQGGMAIQPHLAAQPHLDRFWVFWHTCLHTHIALKGEEELHVVPVVALCLGIECSHGLAWSAKASSSKKLSVMFL